MVNGNIVLTATVEPDRPIKVVDNNPKMAFERLKKMFTKKYRKDEKDGDR